MARYTAAKPKPNSRYTVARTDEKKPVSSSARKPLVFDIVPPQVTEPTQTQPKIQYTPPERELGLMGLPKSYLSQGTPAPERPLPEDSLGRKLQSLYYQNLQRGFLVWIKHQNKNN